MPSASNPQNQTHAPSETQIQAHTQEDKTEKTEKAVRVVIQQYIHYY